MKIKIVSGKEYEIEVQPGESLLGAVQKCTEVAVEANCGGKGICGKCMANLIAGSVLTENGEKEAPNVIKLCKTSALSDCTVEVMSTNPGIARYYADLEDGKGYSVAVDLGTTNITAALTDGKKILSTLTQKNRQSVYGADVMTRIEAATSGKSKELQMIVKRQIADMISKLISNSEKNRSLRDTDIQEIIVSCNTTMEYLLMGWDSSSLGRAPYTTKELIFQETSIAGIKAVLLPGISAFVGGDIVSGLAYLNFTKETKVTFFLDLGTNGEMALWTGTRLITTSVPAGPAFESGNVIYGSELLDFAWKKLCDGTMDESGYLLTQKEFQDDIRTLQMAKAATCAGVKSLLQEAQVSEEAVERVIIAGTFGEYLDPEATVGIGMIPQAWKDKMQVIGNASLKGAMALIADKEMIERANLIREKAENFSLAQSEMFSKIYIDSMNFTK